MRKKITILLLVFAALAFAQVPRIINYQGKLVDPGGVAIDEPRNMTFRLYDRILGGSPLWVESHIGVDVSHGLFDVRLGSVTPFADSVDFTEQYWLEIEVGGILLAPRIALQAVPYALAAATALNATFIDSIHFVDYITYIDSISFIDSIRWIDSIGYIAYISYVDSIGYIDSIGWVGHTVWADSAGWAAYVHWDSIDGIPSGTWVTSLNTLTGDLTCVGAGGIEVTTDGSNLIFNLVLEPGDCPLVVDLIGGTISNQYVPVNLQAFSPTVGQFLITEDYLGCTGGRISGITLYANETSIASVGDVDIWIQTVTVSNLAAGSITPSGLPIVSSTTLNRGIDGTVHIDFPSGFYYTGGNILITIRKNSSSGTANTWKGYTTPAVMSWYNPTTNTFPLPNSASFRPNITFYFLPPEIPDLVTDVNGISGSVRIVGGTDIEVVTLGDSITINYDGTSSGGGGNGWVAVTSGSDTTRLRTAGAWGLSRHTNLHHGVHDSTHINLGVSSITGAAGQNIKYATVSGGRTNEASGVGASIAGGFDNEATDSGSVVGGGVLNSSRGKYSVVAGGNDNNATSLWTTVAGGYNNTASSQNATVSGGFMNTASGFWSTVGGGQNNFAQYDYATVGGGRQNYAAGERSVIPGGSMLKVGARSFGFRGGIGGNPADMIDLSTTSETFHIVDAHFHFNWANSAAWFRVDGDTSDYAIYMNPANDFIGIGMNNPAEKLHVRGNIRATGTITSGSSITIDGTRNPGTITETHGHIHFDDENLTTYGSVGIGTMDMTRKLDVNGTVGISDTLDMRQNQVKNMLLDLRHGENPPSPQVGQIWMRTDF
jgi:hypothetical protein